MCAQRRLRSACAPAQSDQSSLCARWVAKDPSFLHADSEDSYQSGRMPRLIWVFAGRTCHFVGFVMIRLTSSFPWDYSRCHLILIILYKHIFKCKWSISRSDAEFCDVWSWSTLFAKATFRGRQALKVKHVRRKTCLENEDKEERRSSPWQNQQNYLCAQRRLRSGRASAQSGQSLRCALNG